MKGLALPIVALFAAMLAGLLAGPTQPTAAPFEIESVEVIPASKPAEPTGPGFAPNASGCNCDGCLTDGDVRRIVGEELAKRGYASSRPMASSGSSGSPAVETIISERVVSSSPMVVQQSQPQVIRRGIVGRPVFQSSNGTCRIVNGVRICN